MKRIAITATALVAAGLLSGGWSAEAAAKGKPVEKGSPAQSKSVSMLLLGPWIGPGGGGEITPDEGDGIGTVFAFAYGAGSDAKDETKAVIEQWFVATGDFPELGSTRKAKKYPEGRLPLADGPLKDAPNRSPTEGVHRPGDEDENGSGQVVRAHQGGRRQQGDL